MKPIDFFGQNIFSVLADLRLSEDVVDYSKIEDMEYLKLTEKGFYLHSSGETGKIHDCRIYFVAQDDFFPAKESTRGKFFKASTLSDIEGLLGSCIKEIRSLKIPGRSPTLPGKCYQDGNFIVSVFSENGDTINYIHIRVE